jgi:hypothetical protein
MDAIVKSVVRGYLDEFLELNWDDVEFKLVRTGTVKLKDVNVRRDVVSKAIPPGIPVIVNDVSVREGEMRLDWTIGLLMQLAMGSVVRLPFQLTLYGLRLELEILPLSPTSAKEGTGEGTVPEGAASLQQQARSAAVSVMSATVGGGRYAKAGSVVIDGDSDDTVVEHIPREPQTWKIMEAVHQEMRIVQEARMTRYDKQAQEGKVSSLAAVRNVFERTATVALRDIVIVVRYSPPGAEAPFEATVRLESVVLDVARDTPAFAQAVQDMARRARFFWLRNFSVTGLALGVKPLARPESASRASLVGMAIMSRKFKALQARSAKSAKQQSLGRRVGRAAVAANARQLRGLSVHTDEDLDHDAVDLDVEADDPSGEEQPHVASDDEMALEQWDILKRTTFRATVSRQVGAIDSAAHPPELSGDIHVGVLELSLRQEQVSCVLQCLREVRNTPYLPGSTAAEAGEAATLGARELTRAGSGSRESSLRRGVSLPKQPTSIRVELTEMARYSRLAKRFFWRPFVAQCQAEAATMNVILRRIPAIVVPPFAPEPFVIVRVAPIPQGISDQLSFAHESRMKSSKEHIEALWSVAGSRPDMKASGRSSDVRPVYNLSLVSVVRPPPRAAEILQAPEKQRDRSADSSPEEERAALEEFFALESKLALRGGKAAILACRTVAEEEIRAAFRLDCQRTIMNDALLTVRRCGCAPVGTRSKTLDHYNVTPSVAAAAEAALQDRITKNIGIPASHQSDASALPSGFAALPLAAWCALRGDFNRPPPLVRTKEHDKLSPDEVVSWAWSTATADDLAASVLIRGWSPLLARPPPAGADEPVVPSASMIHSVIASSTLFDQDWYSSTSAAAQPRSFVWLRRMADQRWGALEDLERSRKRRTARMRASERVLDADLTAAVGAVRIAQCAVADPPSLEYALGILPPPRFREDASVERTWKPQAPVYVIASSSVHRMPSHPSLFSFPSFTAIGHAGAPSEAIDGTKPQLRVAGLLADHQRDLMPWYAETGISAPPNDLPDSVAAALFSKRFQSMTALGHSDLPSGYRRYAGQFSVSRIGLEVLTRTKKPLLQLTMDALSASLADRKDASRDWTLSLGRIAVQADTGLEKADRSALGEPLSRSLSSVLTLRPRALKAPQLLLDVRPTVQSQDFQWTQQRDPSSPSSPPPPASATPSPKKLISHHRSSRLLPGQPNPTDSEPAVPLTRGTTEGDGTATIPVASGVPVWAGTFSGAELVVSACRAVFGIGVPDWISILALQEEERIPGEAWSDFDRELGDKLESTGLVHTRAGFRNHARWLAIARELDAAEALSLPGSQERLVAANALGATDPSNHPNLVRPNAPDRAPPKKKDGGRATEDTAAALPAGARSSWRLLQHASARFFERCPSLRAMMLDEETCSAMAVFAKCRAEVLLEHPALEADDSFGPLGMHPFSTDGGRWAALLDPNCGLSLDLLKPPVGSTIVGSEARPSSSAPPSTPTRGTTRIPAGEWARRVAVLKASTILSSKAADEHLRTPFNARPEIEASLYVDRVQSQVDEPGGFCGKIQREQFNIASEPTSSEWGIDAQVGDVDQASAETSTRQLRIRSVFSKTPVTAPDARISGVSAARWNRWLASAVGGDLILLSRGLEACLSTTDAADLVALATTLFRARFLSLSKLSGRYVPSRLRVHLESLVPHGAAGKPDQAGAVAPLPAASALAKHQGGGTAVVFGVWRLHSILLSLANAGTAAFSDSGSAPAADTKTPRPGPTTPIDAAVPAATAAAAASSAPDDPKDPSSTLELESSASKVSGVRELRQQLELLAQHIMELIDFSVAAPFLDSQWCPYARTFSWRAIAIGRPRTPLLPRLQVLRALQGRYTFLDQQKRSILARVAFRVQEKLLSEVSQRGGTPHGLTFHAADASVASGIPSDFDEQDTAKAREETEFAARLVRSRSNPHGIREAAAAIDLGAGSAWSPLSTVGTWAASFLGALGVRTRTPDSRGENVHPLLESAVEDAALLQRAGAVLPVSLSEAGEHPDPRDHALVHLLRTVIMVRASTSPQGSGMLFDGDADDSPVSSFLPRLSAAETVALAGLPSILSSSIDSKETQLQDDVDSVFFHAIDSGVASEALQLGDEPWAYGALKASLEGVNASERKYAWHSLLAERRVTPADLDEWLARVSDVAASRAAIAADANASQWATRTACLGAQYATSEVNEAAIVTTSHLPQEEAMLAEGGWCLHQGKLRMAILSDAAGTWGSGGILASKQEGILSRVQEWVPVHAELDDHGRWLRCFRDRSTRRADAAAAAPIGAEILVLAGEAFTTVGESSSQDRLVGTSGWFGASGISEGLVAKHGFCIMDPSSVDKGVTRALLLVADTVQERAKWIHILRLCVRADEQARAVTEDTLMREVVLRRAVRSRWAALRGHVVPQGETSLASASTDLLHGVLSLRDRTASEGGPQVWSMLQKHWRQQRPSLIRARVAPVQLSFLPNILLSFFAFARDVGVGSFLGHAPPPMSKRFSGISPADLAGTSKEDSDTEGTSPSAVDAFFASISARGSPSGKAVQRPRFGGTVGMPSDPSREPPAEETPDHTESTDSVISEEEDDDFDDDEQAETKQGREVSPAKPWHASEPHQSALGPVVSIAIDSFMVALSSVENTSAERLARRVRNQPTTSEHTPWSDLDNPTDLHSRPGASRKPSALIIMLDTGPTSLATRFAPHDLSDRLDYRGRASWDHHNILRLTAAVQESSPHSLLASAIAVSRGKSLADIPVAKATVTVPAHADDETPAPTVTEEGEEGGFRSSVDIIGDNRSSVHIAVEATSLDFRLESGRVRVVGASTSADTGTLDSACNDLPLGYDSSDWLAGSRILWCSHLLSLGPVATELGEIQTSWHEGTDTESATRPRFERLIREAKRAAAEQGGGSTLMTRRGTVATAWAWLGHAEARISLGVLAPLSRAFVRLAKLADLTKRELFSITGIDLSKPAKTRPRSPKPGAEATRPTRHTDHLLRAVRLAIGEITLVVEGEGAGEDRRVSRLSNRFPASIRSVVSALQDMARRTGKPEPPLADFAFREVYRTSVHRMSMLAAQTTPQLAKWTDTGGTTRLGISMSPSASNDVETGVLASIGQVQMWEPTRWVESRYAGTWPRLCAPEHAVSRGRCIISGHSVKAPNKTLADFLLEQESAAVAVSSRRASRSSVAFRKASKLVGEQEDQHVDPIPDIAPWLLPSRSSESTELGSLLRPLLVVAFVKVATPPKPAPSTPSEGKDPPTTMSGIEEGATAASNESASAIFAGEHDPSHPSRWWPSSLTRIQLSLSQLYITPDITTIAYAQQWMTTAQRMVLWTKEQQRHLDPLPEPTAPAVSAPSVPTTPVEQPSTLLVVTAHTDGIRGRVSTYNTPLAVLALGRAAVQFRQAMGGTMTPEQWDRGLGTQMSLHSTGLEFVLCRSPDWFVRPLARQHPPHPTAAAMRTAVPEPTDSDPWAFLTPSQALARRVWLRKRLMKPALSDLAPGISTSTLLHATMGSTQRSTEGTEHFLPLLEQELAEEPAGGIRQRARALSDKAIAIGLAAAAAVERDPMLCPSSIRSALSLALPLYWSGVEGGVARISLGRLAFEQRAKPAQPDEELDAPETFQSEIAVSFRTASILVEPDPRGVPPGARACLYHSDPGAPQAPGAHAQSDQRHREGALTSDSARAPAPPPIAKAVSRRARTRASQTAKARGGSHSKHSGPKLASVPHEEAQGMHAAFRQWPLPGWRWVYGLASRDHTPKVMLRICPLVPAAREAKSPAKEAPTVRTHEEYTGPFALKAPEPANRWERAAEEWGGVVTVHMCAPTAWPVTGDGHSTVTEVGIGELDLGIDPLTMLQLHQWYQLSAEAVASARREMHPKMARHPCFATESLQQLASADRTEESLQLSAFVDADQAAGRGAAALSTDLFGSKPVTRGPRPPRALPEDFDADAVRDSVKKATAAEGRTGIYTSVRVARTQIIVATLIDGIRRAWTAVDLEAFQREASSDLAAKAVGERQPPMGPAQFAGLHWLFAHPCTRGATVDFLHASAHRVEVEVTQSILKDVGSQHTTYVRTGPLLLLDVAPSPATKLNAATPAEAGFNTDTAFNTGPIVDFARRAGCPKPNAIVGVSCKGPSLHPASFSLLPLASTSNLWNTYPSAALTRQLPGSEPTDTAVVPWDAYSCGDVASTHELLRVVASVKAHRALQYLRGVRDAAVRDLHNQVMQAADSAARETARAAYAAAIESLGEEKEAAATPAEAPKSTSTEQTVPADSPPPTTPALQKMLVQVKALPHDAAAAWIELAMPRRPSLMKDMAYLIRKQRTRSGKDAFASPSTMLAVDVELAPQPPWIPIVHENREVGAPMLMPRPPTREEAQLSAKLFSPLLLRAGTDGIILAMRDEAAATAEPRVEGNAEGQLPNAPLAWTAMDVFDSKAAGAGVGVPEAMNSLTAALRHRAKAVDPNAYADPLPGESKASSLLVTAPTQADGTFEDAQDIDRHAAEATRRSGWLATRQLLEQALVSQDPTTLPLWDDKVSGERGALNMFADEEDELETAPSTDQPSPRWRQPSTETQIELGMKPKQTFSFSSLYEPHTVHAQIDGYGSSDDDEPELGSLIKSIDDATTEEQRKGRWTQAVQSLSKQRGDLDARKSTILASLSPIAGQSWMTFDRLATPLGLSAEAQGDDPGLRGSGNADAEDAPSWVKRRAGRLRKVHTLPTGKGFEQTRIDRRRTMSVRVFVKDCRVVYVPKVINEVLAVQQVLMEAGYGRAVWRMGDLPPAPIMGFAEVLVSGQRLEALVPPSSMLDSPMTRGRADRISVKIALDTIERSSPLFPQREGGRAAAGHPVDVQVLRVPVMQNVKLDQLPPSVLAPTPPNPGDESAVVEPLPGCLLGQVSSMSVTVVEPYGILYKLASPFTRRVSISLPLHVLQLSTQMPALLGFQQALMCSLREFSSLFRNPSRPWAMSSVQTMSVDLIRSSSRSSSSESQLPFARDVPVGEASRAGSDPLVNVVIMDRAPGGELPELRECPFPDDPLLPLPNMFLPEFGGLTPSELCLFPIPTGSSLSGAKELFRRVHAFRSRLSLGASGSGNEFPGRDVPLVEAFSARCLAPQVRSVMLLLASSGAGPLLPTDERAALATALGLSLSVLYPSAHSQSWEVSKAVPLPPSSAASALVAPAAPEHGAVQTLEDVLSQLSVAGGRVRMSTAEEESGSRSVDSVLALAAAALRDALSSESFSTHESLAERVSRVALLLESARRPVSDALQDTEGQVSLLAEQNAFLLSQIVKSSDA